MTRGHGQQLHRERKQVKQKASVAAVALATLLIATSCGGSASAGSFSGDGVRFAYPSNWRPVDLDGSAGQDLLWEHPFGPGQYYSHINVQAYSTNAGIDASNIDAHVSEISAFLESMAESGGQSLTSDAELTKLGGIPAVEGDLNWTERRLQRHDHLPRRHRVPRRMSVRTGPQVGDPRRVFRSRQLVPVHRQVARAVLVEACGAAKLRAGSPPRA